MNEAKNSYPGDGGTFNLVAHALKAKSNLDHREDSDNLVTHSLCAGGFDASENGTGRGMSTDLRRHDDRHRGMLRDKPCLNASNNDLVGVRRLTPIECARLQGFPDDWTCLCDQKPCVCLDGPQYKAYGNAVTVNVIEWVGRRLSERSHRD